MHYYTSTTPHRKVVLHSTKIKIKIEANDAPSQSLSSSLSPPVILKLRPVNAVRSLNSTSMSASKFRYLVPINAVAAEDSGGASNGPVSSSSTPPPTESEGKFKN